MLEIFFAIIPIFGALFAGYFISKLLTPPVTHKLIRAIIPLIYCLMIAIGYHFGAALSQPSQTFALLKIASYFAVATIFTPFIIIFFYLKYIYTTSQIKITYSKQSLLKFWYPLKNCLTVIGLIGLGVIIHKFLPNEIPSSALNHLFLYLLIFLVGIDINAIPIKIRNPLFLIIPLLVMIGSWLGGLIVALLIKQSLIKALALSSGFGWFTLSSIIIARHFGNYYGSLALLIDLLREMLAIILLYLLGGRHAKAGIGVCGAAAMDSALPIIKQTCQTEEIPFAIATGIILTLAAPILITIFVNWSLQ